MEAQRADREEDGGEEEGVPEDEWLPPRHAPARIGVGAKLKIQCILLKVQIV